MYAPRALSFLRLGSHSRIIQVAEKIPWHSHSWLCASDKSDQLSVGWILDHPLLCRGALQLDPLSFSSLRASAFGVYPDPVGASLRYPFLLGTTKRSQ
jgi:hypothetical protein